MKRLARPVLFGAIACGSFAAQSVQTPAGPPNVRILSGHWALRVIKEGAPIVAPNSQTVPHEDQPIEPIDPTPEVTGRARPERIYVYSTEILNTGPKDIKRLSWTYSFVDGEKHSRRVFSGLSIDKIRRPSQ